jgi:hypothetical protein
MRVINVDHSPKPNQWQAGLCLKHGAQWHLLYPKPTNGTVSVFKTMLSGLDYLLSCPANSELSRIPAVAFKRSTNQIGSNKIDTPPSQLQCSE